VAATAENSEEKRPHILEIGETQLFHWAMPEETVALYASYRADLRKGRKWLTLRRLLKARADIKAGRYDAVVLHPPFYAGWHPRSFMAALKFTLLKGRLGDFYGALVSPLIFQLTRFLPDSVPLVAIDRSDSFGTPRHHFFLLDKARIFYKRELPVDHWQVFYGSGHRRLPGLSFRMKEVWKRRMGRLRPIGLGATREQAVAARKIEPGEKTSDVFFAGSSEGNSWVRQEVKRQIDALRARGVKVDVPQERLSLEDYLRRCSQAWLTLSPEGLGWDCYRHNEAAMVGSVPLVSVPTIHRFRPLLVGEQCLAYFPDEDRLADVVVAALADKDRLKRMAVSARKHAWDNHTERALCEAILADIGVDPGPPSNWPDR
jgi:hypothetical protein